MSYSFRIEAKGGALTVGTPSGTVPDGTYEVTGHDDAGSRNISVQQITGGQTVVSASGFAKRV